jgi:hypothetical protein
MIIRKATCIFAIDIFLFCLQLNCPESIIIARLHKLEYGKLVMLRNSSIWLEKFYQAINLLLAALFRGYRSDIGCYLSNRLTWDLLVGHKKKLHVVFYACLVQLFSKKKKKNYLNVRQFKNTFSNKFWKNFIENLLWFLQFGVYVLSLKTSAC